MKVIVCKNYEEASLEAANILISGIKENPSTVLGLATGSTPIGTYQNLITACKNKEISFADVKSYNLDEYYPISRTNDQSYFYFMNEQLFSHIDIKPENTHVPNGEVSDPEAECAAYDKEIEEVGGIDIQVLGIGNNGHIGFNEPEEALYAATHITGLTESTIEANKRFFASADDVPKQALTMGMATILKAKKIVMIATGAGKKEIVAKLLSGRITTEVPASLLHCHRDVTVIVDEAAYQG